MPTSQVEAQSQSMAQLVSVSNSLGFRTASFATMCYLELPMRRGSMLRQLWHVSLSLISQSCQLEMRLKLERRASTYQEVKKQDLLLLVLSMHALMCSSWTILSPPLMPMCVKMCSTKFSAVSWMARQEFWSRTPSTLCILRTISSSSRMVECLPKALTMT